MGALTLIYVVCHLAAYLVLGLAFGRARVIPPLGRLVPCINQSYNSHCVSHAPARAAVPGHCPVVRWIRTSRARRLAEPF